MSTLDKIPLKTFWEAVERRLAACSTKELRAILRAMAQETPPARRQTFLGKLERTAGPVAASAQEVMQQDDLLADIEDLTQELKEATKRAEPWEEHYGWDEYDDEDSLGPYEEYVEPLVELFDRAEAAFDYGNLALARAALQKLFETLGLEDDYGRGVRSSDLAGVDADEAGARYLRAVYETEPPEGRPQALFEGMRLVQVWLMRPRPMLEDLLQISPRPFPDRERFLADWIAFLRTQSGRDADVWLREATRLFQGTGGLEALARAEGQAHPRAYLDWFTALEEEGRHRAVLHAAQEALRALPEGLAIRAAIADHLCAAAAKLGEAEALRAGRWEAYRAKPALSRLLDLWEAVPAGEERSVLMRQALQYAQAYVARPPGERDEAWWGMDDLERSVWISKSDLAHACLLAGDIEAAYQLAADEPVLGWSGTRNPQGLVVPFLLALLSGRAPGALPANLGQLWQWGLLSGAGLRVGGEGSPVYKRLERAYEELFIEVSLSDDRQGDILSWCLDVAQRRVDAIVGGQHRKSYDKAAVLTVACAETLRLRGDVAAADSLVAEIRDRFPRHRNFQAELKTAIQRMERSLRR